MKDKIISNVKDIFYMAVLAFVISIALRTFVAEGRLIPTPSMVPTIQIQDRVVVNKFVYRFSNPERGDIVVFDPPAELGATEEFIKRVVGLPGETVEMRNHKVFINGQELIEPYLGEPVDYTWGPAKVPDDCVLVLGDNRNQSYDTHMWRDKDGRQLWLKSDRIKGQAFVMYWPPEHMKILRQESSFAP